MTEEVLQKLLQNWFEEFHRNPELSNNEYRTTKRIREILEKLPGVTVRELGLPTGLYALLNEEAEGPTVALRADIDALPITEASGIPYASENPDVFHACGHDFHMTALLGAALRLTENAHQLPGRILFLFQPAEEVGNGAERVIETGLFWREGIKCILGLHVEPGIMAGTIGLRKGAFSASVDWFEILITGQGGHAAHPEKCLDPIPAAVRLVISLQEIRCRVLDPVRPAVLSVTKVNAGCAYNVIPDMAKVEGTVRTFRQEDRSLFQEQICMRAAFLEAEGYQVKVNWHTSCPPSNNDSELIDIIRQTATELNIATAPYEMELGGEDFAEYQKIVPGALFQVGMGEKVSALHSPAFRAEPRMLGMTSHLLACVTKRVLENFSR